MTSHEVHRDLTKMFEPFLETWLPEVFATLEELARLCHARGGSIGAFIEDKNSGTILLQQALRRQMPARAIDSKLTAMGKDKRAISVSGYVHRESVSTRAEPSRRRSSTSDAQEIICLTKSRAFALVTEAATARTTFSTHSATASR
jgi:hypothetical protein